MNEPHRWIGAISSLIGVWVFASAFAFDLAGIHFWNNVVVGASIVVFAGYNAVQGDASEASSTFSSIFAGLLGLWTIATPFIYEATTVTRWSSVVSGVVVAVLSGYGAYEKTDFTDTSTTGTAGS